MEWVEVRGRSIDVAVEAGMRELGIDDRDQVEIEILEEPERGFLGIGGKDAVVKLKPKKTNKRRRRRKGKGEQQRQDAKPQKASSPRQQGDQKDHKGQRGRSDSGPQRQKEGQQRQKSRSGGGNNSRNRKKQNSAEKGAKVTIEEQAPVVEEFLGGLVKAFGLEGDVNVRIDDETIVADIAGPQTAAMVGQRGSVIEAIHELSKTVLQRKTQASARVRLDIAGYAERRRQALSIYADQLIDQVLEEGGEIMLEPMSAGDRKVIHDAVAAREGVRSYSEGESPQRYVVISKAEEGDSEEE